MRLNTKESFYKKVSISANGCWNFNGALLNNGYTRSRFQGKGFLAHRLSYILTFGDIPDGLLVCHKCDNRVCVNPDHLFLGTHTDNAHDRMKKGRSNHTPRKKLSVCKNGHDTSLPESRFKSNGVCRKCSYIRTMKWYYKNKVNSN